MSRTTSKQSKARALYDDTLYYDHAYYRYRKDIPFYVKHAVRSKGPVLELGVGTGRLAIAIARQGIATVGLDLSSKMLRRAKERMLCDIQAKKHLRLYVSDMRNFRLRRRFNLIYAPFNVLMHAHTREDIEGTLRCIRMHLRPNGRFIFDVLLPDVETFAQPTNYRCSGTAFRNPSDGLRYAYSETFHYEPVTQIQTITMHFKRTGRASAPFTIALRQRQFYPAELKSLLHYNGFKVLSHAGGFRNERLQKNSDSQVLVCARA